MAVVDEWVAKAEEDYAGAVALCRRRKTPLPSLVCFHAQQCAEKYLKAYLVYLATQPPKIHDLPRLLRLCGVRDPSCSAYAALVHSLNPYGVLVRYPGMPPTTLAEGKAALVHVRRLRRAIRRRLGL